MQDDAAAVGVVVLSLDVAAALERVGHLGCGLPADADELGHLPQTLRLDAEDAHPRAVAAAEVVKPRSASAARIRFSQRSRAMASRSLKDSGSRVVASFVMSMITVD